MNVPITTVYLDMDDVLVDLHRHSYRHIFPDAPDPVIEAMYEATIRFPGIAPIVETYAGTAYDQEALHRLWATLGAEFWRTIPWTKHGKAIIEVCAKHVATLFMSTPVNEAGCVLGKMAWINALPADRRRRYALTPCKHHFAHEGALLVDDNEDNVDRFLSHGGDAMLWPRPWNYVGQLGVTEDEAFDALQQLVSSRGVIAPDSTKCYGDEDE